MAILQTSGTDNTTVEAAPTNESIGSKIGGAFSGLFMDDNEVMDAAGVKWAIMTAAVVGAVGGGMFTRKRVEAGEEAIAGFLF